MPETGDARPNAQNRSLAVLQAKFDQGVGLHHQGKLADAERIYREVLGQQPDHFGALHMLGVIALQTRQTERAVDLIGRAIALNANVAAAYSNLGAALLDRMRPEEALASCDKAIALESDSAMAHNNRGKALYDLKRPADALQSYDRAIVLMPNYAEAHYNRGLALRRLGHAADALATFDTVLELKPNFAEAHNDRGLALYDLMRSAEAIMSYDKAIALKPDFSDAHQNRGYALLDLQRPAEALMSYSKAIALTPESEFLYGIWLFTKLTICDWSDLDSEVAQLVEKLKRGEKVSPPFLILSVSNSPELQRRAAEIWTLAENPPDNTLPTILKRPKRDKIRIGYFSADFYAHATAHLMAELIESHDRSHFEVIAYSFGPDKKDEMQQRISRAFDKFIDVRNQPDRDVAMLARKLEIDIAIDLKGFTTHNRTGIFASRAAPLQVNYLGYPGTMGADYIDYLIADPILIPASNRKDFSEKIIYMPNSYQPNDRERPMADRIISRAEVGLPEGAFVFCCFNNNYKINPTVFDCWMRMLKQVEGSVLWLFEGNPRTAPNLRKEAASREINPDRLVFGKRMSLPDHLTRHGLADLFLDTLPCNAHTTASDALWAGLPVLTCFDATFAGRVAASLLNAIGLPELVTTTLEAYEQMAVDLAMHPQKLAIIKRKLADNRLTTPLFDTKLYTKHIEAAYSAIYERYQAGLPPDHIIIPN